MENGKSVCILCLKIKLFPDLSCLKHLPSKGYFLLNQEMATKKNKLENDLELTYESKQVVIYLCLQSITYKICV